MSIKLLRLLNYLLLFLAFGFGLTIEAQIDKNLEKTAATVIKNMVAIRSDSAGISNLGYGLITGESESSLFIITSGSLVSSSPGRGTSNNLGVKVQLGDQIIEATVLNKWSNLNIALLEMPKPSTSTFEPLKVDPNPNHFAACLFPKNANETSLQPLEKAISTQDSIAFKLKGDIERIEGIPVISEKGLVGVVINSNANNLICINITKISNLLNGNGRFPFNSLLSNAIPSAKKTAPAVKTKELYSYDGKSKVLPIILTSVGIAAGAYSYITYKQSQDSYQTYKDDRNPLSPTYTELYREGYLDQANSKLIIAQACAAGSAISLTIGLITLFKKGNKSATPKVSFISNASLLSNYSKLQFYNFLPNGIAFSIPLRNSK
jgi:hypothetical protein